MNKFELSSTFALVEFQKGRKKLAKIVEAGHRVPIIMVGYLSPGTGPVGHDDGVGIQFGCDVLSVVLGEPEYVPMDKIGRPWALLSELKPGDTVTFDGAFDCIKKGAKRKVKQGDDMRLFVKCEDGRHYLMGQLGEGRDADALIGVYKVD